MRLALFDLDDTLIEGDSDVEWSEVLAAHGAMDRTRLHAFHAEYERGTLDIEAFLRFHMEPLVREPLDELFALRRKWLVQRIQPRIRPAARDLVRAHARAGHVTALITANLRFLAEPIAEELSIEHVIASEAEIDGGRFTGNVAGVPCFREGKIERLRQWLTTLGLDSADVLESWFYSDSHNDLPLLEAVTHPVCVNPDRVLAAHAGRVGWPQLDLRQIETEYSSPPIG